MRTAVYSYPLYALLTLAGLARGHGGGHGDDNEDLSDMTYAERHMATEHHIDSFDLESFFKLHDLDRDGILSRSELEAIYGLHHETSRDNSASDEEHKRKTDEILAKVLATLDQNGDGIITKTEFVSAGREGLPEFSDHEGLGHHYDSEGEYFLHHEEMYHNTPETQTEESYTHPEDIAHFEHHEDIEREEEDRARIAQGLPATNPDIPLDDQTAQPDHDEVDAALASGQKVFKAKEDQARDVKAQQLQADKVEAASRGAWGEGTDGFRKPKDKADRLRERIPYKYRVRSSFFGDF